MSLDMSVDCVAVVAEWLVCLAGRSLNLNTCYQYHLFYLSWKPGELAVALR